MGTILKDIDEGVHVALAPHGVFGSQARTKCVGAVRAGLSAGPGVGPASGGGRRAERAQDLPSASCHDAESGHQSECNPSVH
jgi:hypothetical protein